MNPYRAWIMGSFDETAEAAGSAHGRRLGHDHALAARYGLGTVWEAAGWRAARAEGGRGAGDGADGWLHAVLASAQRNGLQVAWTLVNGHWPDGLDPTQAGFAARLGDFAAATARAVARGDPTEVHVYQPIRSGAAVEARCAEPPGLPDEDARAWRHGLHRALAHAADEAHAAIRASDPHAWLVAADDVADGALRGASAADGISVVPDAAPSPAGIADAETLRAAFASMVRRLDASWLRHGKPLVVFGAEAVGGARGPSLEMLAQAAQAVGAGGASLQGLCLAPLLDERAADGTRPRHGLWAVDGDGARIPEPDYARSLSRCQRASMPRRRRAGAPAGAVEAPSVPLAATGRSR